MWTTLLPDPFVGEDGAALDWMRDHWMLLPIPYAHPPHPRTDFRVRVVPEYDIQMTSADRALIQLLFAARQRLTARLSAVETLAWPTLRAPPEDPAPSGAVDVYMELALLHAQLRTLTSSWPQLGLYNEAWGLFNDDMVQYAPWVCGYDSLRWAGLVHRQLRVWAAYVRDKADYDRAAAEWEARASPRHKRQRGADE